MDIEYVNVFSKIFYPKTCRLQVIMIAKKKKITTNTGHDT